MLLVDILLPVYTNIDGTRILRTLTEDTTNECEPSVIQKHSPNMFKIFSTSYTLHKSVSLALACWYIFSTVVIFNIDGKPCIFKQWRKYIFNTFSKDMYDTFSILSLPEMHGIFFTHLKIIVTKYKVLYEFYVILSS